LIDRKANNNNGKSWRAKIADLRVAAVEAGYPDLLLANNEYGGAKAPTGPASINLHAGCCRLIFCRNILSAATTWPASGPTFAGVDTGLLDKSQNYRRNPQTLGWELLADAHGATMVASTSSHPYVYGFTAKTDTEILSYLLNKTESNQTMNIVFEGLVPDAEQSPQGTAIVDTADHWGTNQALTVSYNNGTYSTVLPAMSYSLIRFMRAEDEPLFVAEFDTAETNESAALPDINTGTAWDSWSGLLLTGKGFIRAAGTNHAVLVGRYQGAGFELNANLTSTIPVDGAAVSFKTALRRTGAGKNITNQGLDGSGGISFELEIDSTAPPTLGYVHPVDGFTLIPEGSPNDIKWMDDTLDSAKLKKVTLYLSPSGYRVYNDGTWISAVLPYNGSASELAQVRFSGNVNAGLWLDDVTVEQNPDSDGDGQPDISEHIAGSDANDPESRWEVSSEHLPDNQILLGWPSAVGRTYPCTAQPTFWNRLLCCRAISISLKMRMLPQLIRR